MSFCCGSSGSNKISRQVREFAAEPPELEDFVPGGRLDRGLADRLSRIVPPRNVERGEASVNLDAHKATSQTPRLRRMSSMSQRPSTAETRHLPAGTAASHGPCGPACLQHHSLAGCLK